jgi:hypothetical protein
MFRKVIGEKNSLSAAEPIDDEQAAHCGEKVNGAVYACHQAGLLFTQPNTLLQQRGQVVSQSINTTELLHELCATGQQDSSEVLRLVAAAKDIQGRDDIVPLLLQSSADRQILRLYVLIINALIRTF